MHHSIPVSGLENARHNLRVPSGRGRIASARAAQAATVERHSWRQVAIVRVGEAARELRGEVQVRVAVRVARAQQDAARDALRGPRQVRADGERGLRGALLRRAQRVRRARASLAGRALTHEARARLGRADDQSERRQRHYNLLSVRGLRLGARTRRLHSAFKTTRTPKNRGAAHAGPLRDLLDHLAPDAGARKPTRALEPAALVVPDHSRQVRVQCTPIQYYTVQYMDCIWMVDTRARVDSDALTCSLLKCYRRPATSSTSQPPVDSKPGAPATPRSNAGATPLAAAATGSVPEESRKQSAPSAPVVHKPLRSQTQPTSVPVANASSKACSKVIVRCVALPDIGVESALQVWT